MVNLKLSPGDPIFFLHHAWLDRLWWLWQSAAPDTRLTEIGGVNIPASTLPPILSGANGKGSPPAPFPGLTDYFNDPGNVTTLSHTLWSVGLRPNATIGDVMDLHSPLVCADYS